MQHIDEFVCKQNDAKTRLENIWFIFSGRLMIQKYVARITVIKVVHWTEK